MQLNGLIYSFPSYVRHFLIAFVIILSIGYYTGLLFVSTTTNNSPQGIEENYLGNEDDEDAGVMKFKKGDREMLTTLHTHILSIGFIFFLQGLILIFTDLSKKIKSFLLIEPFVSIIVTFGGIFLLWKGIPGMQYLIMISGMLMTVCFTTSTIVILKQLLTTKK